MAPDHSTDWRPTASLEMLKLRAQLLARVREFFARRGVLEVETPALNSAGTTAPNLDSFKTQSLAPGDRSAPRYLHTSPEFAMKRLLAAGSGSIYQICKVFRAGEAGRLHNPEFTMIEWYRVGIDHHELMDEVAALVAAALDGFRSLAATEKYTYGDTFRRHVGCDPHAATSRDLATAAKARGLDVASLAPDDVDGWRDLLLTHVVEPQLSRDRLTFLYDYPASAATLARIRPGNPPVAERFELYLDGVELANGFHELTDADEQRQRFEHDVRLRAERGHPTIPMDTHLLAALANGLPNCSGVALGFDRLVIAASGARTIAEVIAFSFERA